MNFAPNYLVYRFFYRIFDFFHHWYVDGSRNFAYWVINFFEQLDQTFALKVTLKYFFQPLYKDYTVIGRILGIIFRSGRILFGLAVYLLFGSLFLILYALWASFPPLLLLYALENFGRTIP